MPFNTNAANNSVVYTDGTFSTSKVLTADQTVNNSATLVTVPEFKIPVLNYDVFFDLFNIGTTLAILGYIHAISIAKKLEEKHNYYKIDTNQELFAIGMSNIIGSLFQSYPVTGGLSRSAVNDESGAVSGISAIISSLVVALIEIF